MRDAISTNLAHQKCLLTSFETLVKRASMMIGTFPMSLIGGQDSQEGVITATQTGDCERIKAGIGDQQYQSLK